MQYVTNAERFGEERGRQAGIQIGEERNSLKTAREAVLEALEVRFGMLPDSIKNAL